MSVITSEEPISATEMLVLRRLSYVAALEQNWREVLRELSALEDDYFRPSPAGHLYEKGKWDQAELTSYGKPNAPIRTRCPVTAELVDRFPGLTNARFSRLRAGVRVQPHRGIQAFSDRMLRMHLGLKVPANCGMCVQGMQFLWRPGESVFFDDSHEHYVWNDSGEDRTVLLLDFKDPRPLAMSA